MHIKRIWTICCCQQFEENAQPSLDRFGRPMLQGALADEPVSLGISRGSFFSNEPPSELQREILVTRLKAELTAGRAPRTSSIGLRDDWELLQRVVAAGREGVTAHAEIGNRWTPKTP